MDSTDEERTNPRFGGKHSTMVNSWQSVAKIDIGVHYNIITMDSALFLSSLIYYLRDKRDNTIQDDIYLTVTLLERLMIIIIAMQPYSSVGSQLE